MTIREIINYATGKLSKKSNSSALDAEVLLAFVLDKPKEYLYTNPKKILLSDIQRRYLHLIHKRALGWPIAYLTGYKEFFGLDFIVNKNVLIPRPETEGLVELVLDSLPLVGRAGRGKLRILDIGTGSGCIIISLAKTLYPLSSKPSPLFFASDVSPATLKVAKQNARRHKVKITFKQGDLLETWKNQPFDIIVANLPYLAKETDLSTKFEPKKALIAKKKGLALFEKLFQEILYNLNPLPSFIFLEIGHDQAGAINKFGRKYFPQSEITILKDLYKKNRFVKIKTRR